MTSPIRYGPTDRMAAFCRIVGDHMKSPDRDDRRAVRVVGARLARDNRRWDAAHPEPKSGATFDAPGPGSATTDGAAT